MCAVSSERYVCMYVRSSLAFQVHRYYNVPPKDGMLAWTHSSASHWSLNPKFPSTRGSSHARNPKADKRYPMLTQISSRSAATYCACDPREWGDPNCKNLHTVTKRGKSQQITTKSPAFAGAVRYATCMSVRECGSPAMYVDLDRIFLLRRSWGPRRW